MLYSLPSSYLHTFFGFTRISIACNATISPTFIYYFFSICRFGYSLPVLRFLINQIKRCECVLNRVFVLFPKRSRAFGVARFTFLTRVTRARSRFSQYGSAQSYATRVLRQQQQTILQSFVDIGAQGRRAFTSASTELTYYTYTHENTHTHRRT